MQIKLREKVDIDMPIVVAEKARDYFILGYHCSESMIKAFNEEYNLKFTPKMIRMATGLGGGLGKAKCSCGVLTTGAIILSSFYGRVDLRKDDTLAFDLSKELHDRFKEKFKVTCCRGLTKNIKWGHPDHVENCSKYVYEASIILKDILDRSLKSFGRKI